LRNPVVYFQSPGQHLAILQITDANGQTDTDSLYVTLSMFSFQTGIQEDFQQAFLPQGWSVIDHNGNGTWTLSTSAGGFGASSQATFFNNYDIDSQGSFDDLVMPIETSYLSIQPSLYFDVAYARWGSGYSDSLQVVVSSDCFATEQMLYFKGGENLATSPDNQSFFTPTSAQWRKDSVDLSSYANLGNVQIAFRNIGDWGNCMYLDNINLGSLANLSEVQLAKRTIYPNPACPGSTIHMTGPAANFARLLDMKGKEVLRIQAQTNFELPQNLKPGTYLLQVHSTQLISNHSLIIVE
jgi:hypothetical protein